MNLVYTAIYGGYDKLWEPKSLCKGWEYRCYTDNAALKSSKWKIIYEVFPDISPAKSSKYIKIMHPMEHYENILWIDGCVEIKGNLNEFLSKLPKGDIVPGKHPINHTLESELKACISMRKDDPLIMKNQIEGYKGIKPFETTQNTIILRRKDLKASKVWWEEVKNKSKRDQLSFGWAMQQCNQKYSTYPWSLAEKYFNWHKQHLK